VELQKPAQTQMLSQNIINKQGETRSKSKSKGSGR